MCVCVCVCVCVCSHPLSSPPCGVRSPPNTIPPVHSAANGDLEFSGVAIFCIPALVQVGLRVPTPLSGRDGQFSCELLALLQEFASIGSECLLNARAAWFRQVSVIAQRQQYNLHFLFCILHFAFCILCMYVCTEAVLSV